MKCELDGKNGQRAIVSEGIDVRSWNCIICVLLLFVCCYLELVEVVVKVDPKGEGEGEGEGVE